MERTNINTVKNKLCALLLSGTMLLLSTASYAQYKLDDQVSFIYINGTSTLHEWTAIVGAMQGSLNAEVDGDHIDKLDDVRITIPVTSLKSGKKLMDENMYKALKGDKFPEIQYKLVDYSMDQTVIKVKGELTIAGVTKVIQSKITYQDMNEHIKFYGQLHFTMSEFNIDAPEFMFGAFKTGDEVFLKFYFMFNDKG